MCLPYKMIRTVVHIFFLPCKFCDQVLTLRVGNVDWEERYAGVQTTNAAAAAKSLQSCPTLCNPIDGSPLGSPVPGILQARTLEWVAISFSNA